MRLPGSSLDDMAVAMAGVVARLGRPTCLVEGHVRQYDEVFRLLTRANTLLLQCLEDEVHCLLEVGAQTLTTTTIADGLDAFEDVAVLGELVPGWR